MMPTSLRICPIVSLSVIPSSHLGFNLPSHKNVMRKKIKKREKKKEKIRRTSIEAYLKLNVKGWGCRRKLNVGGWGGGAYSLSLVISNGTALIKKLLAAHAHVFTFNKI